MKEQFPDLPPDIESLDPTEFMEHEPGEIFKRMNAAQVCRMAQYEKWKVIYRSMGAPVTEMPSVFAITFWREVLHRTPRVFKFTMKLETVNFSSQ
jgi:hypothetical protein